MRTHARIHARTHLRWYVKETGRCMTVPMSKTRTSGCRPFAHKLRASNKSAREGCSMQQATRRCSSPSVSPSCAQFKGNSQTADRPVHEGNRRGQHGKGVCDLLRLSHGVRVGASPALRCLRAVCACVGAAWVRGADPDRATQGGGGGGGLEGVYLYSDDTVEGPRALLN